MAFLLCYVNENNKMKKTMFGTLFSFVFFLVITCFV